ncbi:FUSC family protein [Pseudonocardia spinosispora]|uniref:FUSC family protein n=1 Tax=Pseudonocardia spinosispora TaxID=103441 RepID=UPI0012EB9273|nr:FUSC family protein [Pseudonocardia spinosispora]
MIVRWLASLADRFFASDHGMVRFRYAAQAVLSVVLAVGVLAPMGLPSTELLFGAVAAMVCSTSMRTGTVGQRAVNILIFGPVMALSLTVATLLTPYPIVGDAVFVLVMFTAVYVRRFDQLGNSLGMGAFMAFFFAMFLKAAPAQLPLMYFAVLVGLLSCSISALLVFRETPASVLRRTTGSIRAQVARLIEELAKLLDDGEPLPESDELPHGVARQASLMHQTTLQIEDYADLLGLDPQWQRQLVDAELSADRLARSTVRALGDGLDAATRADLAEDMRGLHRFVDRNPTAALTLDVDELLNRIARYDIRGDAGQLATKPEHHTLLVRRAIRELLLSVVQMRQTTTRVLSEPPVARKPGEVSEREPTLEDADDLVADVERDAASPTGPDARLDVGPDGKLLVPEDDKPSEAASHHHEIGASTRSAIQAAIGGALAIMGGELLSDQRWYWAVIAGFIVFAGTTSRGDLLVKGWRRVWGTLLGIIAGTVLATLLAGNKPVNLVLLLICIFLAFYSLRVSYGMMTFFITVMLGMLYDILGTFTPDLLLLRLEETAIGVGSSAIAAMLVLPTRTRSTVLTELHDYFIALHDQLRDAERLLVHADRVSVIAATREVDRAATDVRTAIAPMLHRLSPSRVRRGHATRLLTLTEESSLAARNLARAAEPGALAELPAAGETLDRMIANTEVLLAATGTPPATAKLVSGPALAPTVDVRALAEANAGGGEPSRITVLHLRRTINSLDRLDKLLLGMAAPLAQTISVPRHQPPAQSSNSPREI